GLANSRARASGLPSRVSAIASACSAGTPRRTWSSTASRRCSSSSATKSLLPPTRAESRDRQAAICCSRSAMLQPPEFVQRHLHHLPLLLLAAQHLAARSGQGIVSALAAGLRFGPARPHIALRLQPVQHGVEHAVGRVDGVAGKLALALNERVAVILPLFEYRKNGRRRRGGHEVLGEFHTGDDT